METIGLPRDRGRLHVRVVAGRETVIEKAV
jgi:hypothetical protein